MLNASDLFPRQAPVNGPSRLFAWFQVLLVLLLPFLLASCRSVDRSGLQGPEPPPLIQAFAPGTPLITAGDTTSLLATFTGEGFVQGLGPIGSGLPLAVSPAVTTTYVLTVLAPDGRSETRQTTLQVVPPPVSPVILGGSETLVEQAPATFHVDPAAGLTYRWTLQGSGTLVAGADTPEVALRAGAPGTLVLGCAALNAAGRQTPWVFRAVTVIPLPTSLTLTAPATAFAGETGLGAWVPSQPGSTYAWEITGGQITAGAGTPALTFTAGDPGSLLLRCTLTDAFGQQTTASRTVQVLPAPLITAPAFVTAGLGASAQAAAATPGTPLAWTLINATLDSGNGSPTIAFTPVAPGSVVLMCTDGTVTYVRELTAVAPPSITSFQAVNDLVGTQAPAILQAAFADGSATVDPGGLAIRAGEALTTAPLQTGTTFTLTVTNAAGAQATRTCRVEAAAIERVAGFPNGAGTRNGSGQRAFFLRPGGLAVDAVGNLYVADPDAHAIRMIDLTRAVTTLAGDPLVPGSLDGPVAEARFVSPVALAWSRYHDALFVADPGGHVIRRIQEGTVRTWAGLAGSPGDTDGPFMQARLRNPTALVATDDGGLYFIDSTESGARIRWVSPTQEVTTYAGSGSGTSSDALNRLDAGFGSLGGMARDGAGNLYVTDTSTHTIRVIQTEGPVRTLAGGAGEAGWVDAGTGTEVRFNTPMGITFNPLDGTLTVADRGNNRVRKVDPGSGATTTLFGSGTAGYVNGPGVTAQVDGVQDLAYLPDRRLVFTDVNNNSLRSFFPNSGVQLFAGHGRPQAGWQDGDAGTATFSGPSGLAREGDGTLYVADTASNLIRRIGPDGQVQTLAGQANTAGTLDGPALGGALFGQPKGLLLGPGRLLISDPLNGTLRTLPLDVQNPQVGTLAGEATDKGTVDGPVALARFRAPEGFAQDAAGVVYIADAEAHVIRRLGTDGTVTTLAGAPDTPGYVDAPGLDARFKQPCGLALQGNTLYVTERGNRTLRAVDLTTTAVRTVAGNPIPPGAQDGVGARAVFVKPAGVAVTLRGDILVADEGASAIRKVTPEGIVTTPFGRLAQMGLEEGPVPGFLGQPRDLVLDPQTGDIFFSDGSAVMRIHFH
ncbi:NHL repeat-containing protein [Mesoterricola sediminis]|uniref:Ig-like domain-containing protein n=1 Tax=Mesoterricola sediminis TaxID=2927980 RepID=A0AA48H2F3_9BACT|nr:hypothetical protein [Mesoterricola sediminis]BDU78735.1 hypothetical protein METESE_36930 [Mesoterricola sediminis]